MGVYLTKRGELLLANKQKRPSRSWVVVAEEVGFEPTVAFTTTVFETVLFGRSSTLPLINAIGATNALR